MTPGGSRGAIRGDGSFLYAMRWIGVLIAALAVLALASCGAQVREDRLACGPDTLSFVYQRGAGEIPDIRGAEKYWDVQEEGLGYDVAAVYGDGRKRVLTDDHISLPLEISPDGRHILFNSGRDGSIDALGQISGSATLYVMDSDGGDQRRLGAEDYYLEFSPDSERIAFLGKRDGKRGLWVADADGGNPRLLDPFGNKGEGLLFGLTWSPDSERISYTYPERESADQFDPYTMIRVVNADGGDPRELTEGPNDLGPSWSPDGERIAFVRHALDPRPPDPEIWTVNPDGGGLRRLVASEDLDVRQIYDPIQFSPSEASERLLFVGEVEEEVNYYGSTRNVNRYVLGVVELGGLRSVLFEPRVRRVGYSQDAEWMSDGKRLVYVAEDKEGFPVGLRAVTVEGEKTSLAWIPNYVKKTQPFFDWTPCALDEARR